MNSPKDAGSPLGTRRRSPLAVCAAVLGALVVVTALLEVAMRVSLSSNVRLRALLGRPSVSTDFDGVTSLRALLRQAHPGIEPNEVFHDFVLNSKGFKTHEYAYEKPEATRRIVVLGDSMTFSSGKVLHADLWTVRLERLLSEASRDDIEVLNLGFPRTGTDLQLRLWQLEGRLIEADLVVLAFFVGNDFTDIGMEDEPTGTSDRLAEHWVTFRAARNLLRVREATAGVDFTGDGTGEIVAEGGRLVEGSPYRYDPETPSLRRGMFRGILKRRARLFDRSATDWFEARLARIEELLIEFQSAVEHEGRRFVVLVLPDELQLDEPLFSSVIEDLGRSAEEYDVERPNRRFGEVCEAAGIPFLDLLPGLRERSKGARVYHPYDTHWNPAGNDIVAQLVRELVLDELLD